MAQMNAYVEVFQIDEWYELIDAGALLLRHSDLSGCLFGVDNYAGYKPLFADRGVPEDISVNFAERYESIREHTFGQSFALYEEIAAIDWDEPAERRDERVHEFILSSDGREALVTKWLHKPGCEGVRAELGDAGEVVRGDRVFRRPVIRRRDALSDTEFPTIIKLMAVLADRFGPRSVRLVVYFD